MCKGDVMQWLFSNVAMVVLPILGLVASAAYVVYEGKKTSWGRRWAAGFKDLVFYIAVILMAGVCAVSLDLLAMWMEGWTFCWPWEGFLFKYEGPTFMWFATYICCFALYVLSFFAGIVAIVVACIAVGICVHHAYCTKKKKATATSSSSGGDAGSNSTGSSGDSSDSTTPDKPDLRVLATLVLNPCPIST